MLNQFFRPKAILFISRSEALLSMGGMDNFSGGACWLSPRRDTYRGAAWKGFRAAAPGMAQAASAVVRDRLP
jgi:hypothetical protein